MLRIGLTGGLGSGKSTVARIFELLGVPVYFADSAAKRLMESDAFIRNSIIELLGAQSYDGGRLNRLFIADKIFKSPELTAAINSIVHPRTISEADNWMLQQEASGKPYAIKEAALIFESGSQQFLDKVIGVKAPEHLRMERVKSRDGITENQIKERMSRQMDEERKMQLCDFIILNDETTLLIPQVLALHETLKALCLQE